MSVSQLLFGYSGRANRFQFWMGQIAIVVLLAVLGFALFSALAVVHGAAAPHGMLASLGIILLSIAGLFIVLLWVSTAVFVKRLHDRNKSWVWTLPSLVPSAICLWVIATQGLQAGLSLQNSYAFNFLQYAILCWIFIELGFLKGTPGGNIYGPPPGVEEAIGAFDEPSAGHALQSDSPTRRSSVQPLPGTVAATMPRAAGGAATRVAGGFGRRRANA